MVLKETQLIITSGNATSTNFQPAAQQGIPIVKQPVNYVLRSGNQTNPAFIPKEVPQPAVKLLLQWP